MNMEDRQRFLALAAAVRAYHEALQSCADDPRRMSTFCTAQGKDLDDLYLEMVDAAGIDLEQWQ
jgi:hypothetical protein